MLPNSEVISFAVLPAEIQLRILSYLTEQELSRAASVSSGWYRFYNFPVLQRLEKEFGFNYERFLASLVDNIKDDGDINNNNTKYKMVTSPKKIYEFWEKLGKVFELLATEIYVSAFDFFNQALPSRGSSFDYIASYQEQMLITQGVSATNAKSIHEVLMKIYKLIENHFEIAALMISDDFGLNSSIENEMKVSNQAIVNLILQVHNKHFKTIDLTQSAFIEPQETLTRMVQHNSRCNKLIIPSSILTNVDKFMDEIMNLDNLTTLIINCKPEELQSLTSDTNSLWKTLLKQHHALKQITIVNCNNPSEVQNYENEIPSKRQKKI